MVTKTKIYKESFFFIISDVSVFCAMKIPPVVVCYIQPQEVLFIFLFAFDILILLKTLKSPY